MINLPELILNDVSFSWHEKSSRVNLGPINLNAKAGQIIGLFGKSGTGKTTLFRLILGELASLRGKISTRNISKIVYHDQMQKLLPWHSAGQNAVACLSDIEKEDKATTIESLFDLSGLNVFENRDATRLSGGQRARVSLVRSLLESCDVLLLDEPFAGIDAVRLSDLLEAVHGHAQDKIIFISSHDPGVLVQLCSKIYCLQTAGDSVVSQQVEISDEIKSLTPALRLKQREPYLEHIETIMSAIYG